MARDDTVDEPLAQGLWKSCTLPGKSKLCATLYMHQYKLVINYLQPHSHTLDIQQFIDDNEQRGLLRNISENTIKRQMSSREAYLCTRSQCEIYWQCW